MPFSLLDLEKNCTCDSINLTHIAWLVLLNYLVKFEKPKMHVNMNSSFNVNYKISVICTKLQWQFHKMFWWTAQYKWTIISQHVFKVSATSMHTWSQTVVPLVNRSLDSILLKVKPRLHQAFLQVIDVINLCFVQHCCRTPQILQSTGPFRWSYMIHLMQFSLVISQCNITFFICLIFTW